MHWSLKRSVLTAALVAAGLASSPLLAGEQANKALFEAIKDGDNQAIKQAIDKGADATATHPGGRTPLIMAAGNASPKAVQMLLDAGANVNATAVASNKTAIMAAARRGDAEIMRMLFEAGAKPDARDQNGRTALMVASKQGHREAMTVLMDNGATAETNDRFGWDVADYAKMGGEATVKHLESLQKKASGS